jgi:hypothetical protein
MSHPAIAAMPFTTDEKQLVYELSRLLGNTIFAFAEDHQHLTTDLVTTALHVVCDGFVHRRLQGP